MVDDDDGRPGGPPPGFTPLPRVPVGAPNVAPPVAPPGRAASRRRRRPVGLWLGLVAIVVAIVGIAAFVLRSASSDIEEATPWAEQSFREQAASLEGVCDDGDGIASIPAYRRGLPGLEGAIVTPESSATISLDDGQRVYSAPLPTLAVCVTTSSEVVEECAYLVGLDEEVHSVVTGADFTFDVVEVHSGTTVASAIGGIEPQGCPTSLPMARDDLVSPTQVSPTSRFGSDVNAAMEEQAEATLVAHHGG